jgi:hypothetical protein
VFLLSHSQTVLTWRALRLRGAALISELHTFSPSTLNSSISSWSSERIELTRW